MNAIVENDHTIVTRHPIFMFYMIAKSLLMLFVALLVASVFIFYRDQISTELTHYVLLPAVLILVNYSIIQLALGIVQYYNKLFIVARDRIIIIEASLILKEDIEVMDLSKVMKIDVECHGLMPNIFNFGNLIMEQQKNEMRIIHFVPDPYQILRIIREKTNYVTGSSNSKSKDIAFFKV